MTGHPTGRSRAVRRVAAGVAVVLSTAGVAGCGDGESDDVAPDDTTEMTSETTPEAPPPGEDEGDDSMLENEDDGLTLSPDDGGS